MSLKESEWKTAFGSAITVDDKCKVLDQTSNSHLNPLTTDIILGFFTFGMAWWRILGRAIDIWFSKSKKYKNLKALWADVTAETNKLSGTIQKACIDAGASSACQLICNCVRLTMALCARTYQELDERGRWNMANRLATYQTLLNTNITINNQKVAWFDFLDMYIPNVKGALSSFTNSPEAKEFNEWLSKRSQKADVLYNNAKIVSTNERLYNKTSDVSISEKDVSLGQKDKTENK